MNQEQVKQWLQSANMEIQEKKDYLSELDRAVGDGDHGVNMARGFSEAEKVISTGEFEDIGDIFKKVAMALISKVGGASGPLYGTAFLKASAVLKGKKECTPHELGHALHEALLGLKQRGKASVGEKTMIDVWEPVIEKWLTYQDHLNYDELLQLARESMEKTKDMEATKGRASYLGKRSVGYLDPGAVSSYLLFNILLTQLKGAA